MKKLAFAAAVLLVSSMAFSTLAACGGDEEKKKPEEAKKEVKGEQKGEAFPTTSNIRYIDRDTLFAHYDYAVEQNKVLQQLALNQEVSERDIVNKGARMEQEFNTKLQNNAFGSEAEAKSAYEAIARYQQEATNKVQASRQATAEKIDKINSAVLAEVDSFIVKFNADKKYDAILFKEVGLYFNPALDITGEVVDGLNAEYKAKNAGKEADKK